MTDTAFPPAAQHYLEQLRHEAAALPAIDRQQLLGQISEHLSESIADGLDAESVLDRLGSPRELVAAAAAEQEPPAPPWRPSPLLWLAVAGITIGTIMLLWGGGMILLTGRGRSLLPLAIPGLLLAVAGIVLLVRELRSSRGDPAAARAKRRIVRWFAVAAIAIGALALALGGLIFGVTGRGRSLLLAIPGIVLAALGIIALVRVRSGRARV